jgi:hypothetical protein
MLMMTPAMLKRLRRQARAKPRQLGEQRRKLVIATVARIIRDDFQAGLIPTKLNYEGALRAGLRSGLCLEGWNWREADHEARELLAEAFTALGAVRPTWFEGQPGYTEIRFERDRCARCRKPIPPERILHRAKYCDPFCTRAAQKAFALERAGEEGKALHAAEEAARWCRAKNAMPPKPCAYCGDMFHPTPATKTRPETKFCTPRCRNKARKGTPQARTGYRGGAQPGLVPPSFPQTDNADGALPWHSARLLF